jgi:hypothetical protein
MASTEAPTYHTGVIVCMCSRAAEFFVILALRACFVVPNRNRDKKFANGDERYNPEVRIYDDLTDKQNLHFRYIGMYRHSCLVKLADIGISA